MLAPLVVVGVAVLLLWGVGRARQAVAASFVGLAVASFVVPSWGRGTNQVALALTARSQFGPALAGTLNPMSARYGVPPVLLLAAPSPSAPAPPGPAASSWPAPCAPAS